LQKKLFTVSGNLLIKDVFLQLVGDTLILTLFATLGPLFKETYNTATIATLRGIQ